MVRKYIIVVPDFMAKEKDDASNKMEDLCKSYYESERLEYHPLRIEGEKQHE